MYTKDTSVWSNDIVEAYEGHSSAEDMKDFIPGHQSSKDVIFVGLSPSTCNTPGKNGSFERLKTITSFVGLHEWSFQNVIPHIQGGNKTSQIVFELLENRMKPFRNKKVIALGNIASTALDKIDIQHLKIPHPSGLNRLWNNRMTKYEVAMMIENYVNDRD
jgi:uracil-DNA glycosylase